MVVTLALAFAVTLLAAVLVSDLAQRTILSTAVLFLLAGILLGEPVLGILHIEPGSPQFETLVELALFTVLFTDGMLVGVRDVAAAWRLPGRALLFGLPLTLLVIAVVAYLLTPLDWMQSFLLAAALSPTDPVFAAALVGRQGVPPRLKRLLNVESGVNDGLALPLVVILLALVRHEDIHGLDLGIELLVGVALGIAIPWSALRLESTRFFSTSAQYEPLLAFAVGALVFSVASMVHGNLFLAAFAGGVTVVSVSERFKEAFHRFGELLTELLKLASLLIFGSFISIGLIADIGIGGIVFAVLVLVVARPIGLSISLLGSGIGRRELAAAAWFGPRGFASVVFALLILKSGAPGAEEMFQLAATVIALSIIVHSSTDVVVARRFKDADVGPQDASA